MIDLYGGHAQRAADQSEKQTAYVDDEKPGFRRCTATTGSVDDSAAAAAATATR
jgi:hypothetical protein